MIKKTMVKTKRIGEQVLMICGVLRRRRHSQKVMRKLSLCV